jgi:branched-chain amino acid transport system substrate-binding protein
MKRMRPVFYFFTAIFMIGLLVVQALAAPAAPSTLPPIKIGALIAYTGPDPLMLEIDKGIKLKLDEVGWKAGNRTIELRTEDYAANAATAVEKARKLVEMDKVDIIVGPVVADCLLAAINYITPFRIPQLALNSIPLNGFRMGGNNVFAHLGEQSGVTQYVGVYASEAGYKTATVIHQDFVAGETLAKGFIDGFQAKGGKIIQRQRVPVGTMDYAPYVTAMQKADCVASWVLPQETLRLLPRYYDSKLGMPFIQIHASFPEVMLNDVGPRAAGIISIHRWCLALDNPLNKKFVEAFVQKNSIIPHYHAAAAYEATSIILEALKATGGETKPAILNEAIRNVKMDLPSGITSFNKEGVGIGDLNILKTVLKDGKIAWEPIIKYKQVTYFPSTAK